MRHSPYIHGLIDTSPVLNVMIDHIYTHFLTFSFFSNILFLRLTMDLGESRYSFNGVKPSNKSEAVMWNKYNDTHTNFEWDWIKIRFWPKNLAEAVIRKSLNYQTRWQLLLYFVGNMDPSHYPRNTIKEIGRAHV